MVLLAKNARTLTARTPHKFINIRPVQPEETVILMRKEAKLKLYFFGYVSLLDKAQDSRH